MRPRVVSLQAITIAAASLLLAAALPPVVSAKSPAETYCYKSVCHRVKSIAETAADAGRPIHVVASYYDDPSRDRFNPRLATSSGELFRALDADSAASPIYPDGTRVLIYAPMTGAAAVVRINNAGPYYAMRLLDVSRGVAEALGFRRRGLAQVVTMVVSAPTADESRYAVGRNYDPVPGYLGVFASAEHAYAAWQALPEARTAIVDVRHGLAEDRAARARAVRIAAGPRGKSRNATSRVLLKPVHLRRPHLLAALAHRKARLAQRAPK